MIRRLSLTAAALLWALVAIGAQAQQPAPSFKVANLAMAPTSSGGGSNPAVTQDTNVPYQSSGCTSGCSFTIPSTVAGHALAIPLGNLANTVAETFAVTDGGDTCAGATGANSGNGGTGGQPYITWIVCPNVGSGRTSVTITTNNTQPFAGEIYEVANAATSGTIYEGGNGAGNGATNVIAFSLSATTSFSNDIILLTGWGGGGSSSISATGGTWVAGVSGLALTQQGTGTGTYSGNLTVAGAATSAYAELAIKP
jgi:hypothetical protein